MCFGSQAYWPAVAALGASHLRIGCRVVDTEISEIFSLSVLSR